MKVEHRPLGLPALLAALVLSLPVTAPRASAQQALLDQVCAGIAAAPKCAAIVGDPITSERASTLVTAAKQGEVATLASALEEPTESGFDADSVAGLCLISEPKDRLLVLYGLAEHYRRPLIGFLRDTPVRSAGGDAADAAAAQKNSAGQLQNKVLPALCATASAAGAGERTTAALAAVSLTQKLIAETAAVEAFRGGAGSGPTADQLRDTVKGQLLCEVRSEADFVAGSDCKFGGQIKSAILDDVASAQGKVLSLAESIKVKAKKLNERYGAWNAVERLLRTYAQVLADRRQGGGGDPDKVAFEEALSTLRSAFEDRQLLASSGEASVWVKSGPSKDKLTCASEGASYPLCRASGEAKQPLYPCPTEPISGRNIESWLICLHSEAMNSVRAAKQAGLPASDDAGGTREQFLDWLWSIDAVAAIAADSQLKLPSQQ